MQTNNYKDYRILPEHRLIVEYYSGMVTTDEFIAFKTAIYNDAAYNPNYNLLQDLRDVRLLMTEDDLVEFLQKIRQFAKPDLCRKVAYITSSPNEVVLTLLFRMLAADLPIFIMVYSTFQPALSWIDAQHQKEEVELALADLKRKNLGIWGTQHYGVKN